MDLSTILTVPVFMLAVIISLITLSFRRMCQFLFTLIKKELSDKIKKWLIFCWEDLVLPVIPMAIGLVFVLFAKKYPIPDMFSHSISARMVFGICIGEVSSFIYRRWCAFWNTFAENKKHEDKEEPDSPK